MNISDKDKKIIYILLIAMIIALPYFFYIKDTKVATEALVAQNVELQNRLTYLQGLDSQRDFYIEETEKMNVSRNEIIASFPADIRQENYTMFLLETEYSSLTINPDTLEAEWVYPIRFDTVSYADNIETPISSEQADTGYIALTNSSIVTYMCYYDGLKYMLEYLMDYEDPMIYTAISMVYDDETGIITGEMELSQYAVSGADRVLEDVIIVPDLDDFDIRGNEEFGVFGPIETNKIETEEEAVEGEEGAEGAEGAEDAEEAEE